MDKEERFSWIKFFLIILTPHSLLITFLIIGDNSKNIFGITNFKDFLEASYYIAAITAVFIARQELNNWRVQKQFNEAEALVLELEKHASQIKEKHCIAKNLIDQSKEKIDELVDTVNRGNYSYRFGVFYTIAKLDPEKQLTEIPYLNVSERYLISAKPEYKAIIDDLDEAIKDANKTTRQQDNKTTRQQDNKTTRQQDNKTTRQQDNKTTRQQDNKTTRQQDNKTTSLSNSFISGANFLKERSEKEQHPPEAENLKNFIIPLDFEKRYKKTEKIESAINEIEIKKQEILDSIYQHRI